MAPGLSFAIVALFFILFALSRVLLRFRDKSISIWELFLWSAIWIGAGASIIYPTYTGDIAVRLGVARGSDIVIYASVIVLYYMTFRMFVMIGQMRKDLTELVRKMAIEKSHT